ncbi:MAG: hypothetical protein WDN24_18310 [Sphingomonas sp.]
MAPPLSRHKQRAADPQRCEDAPFAAHETECLAERSRAGAVDAARGLAQREEKQENRNAQARVNDHHDLPGLQLADQRHAFETAAASDREKQPSEHQRAAAADQWSRVEERERLATLGGWKNVADHRDRGGGGTAFADAEPHAAQEQLGVAHGQPAQCRHRRPGRHRPGEHLLAAEDVDEMARGNRSDAEQGAEGEAEQQARLEIADLQILLDGSDDQRHHDRSAEASTPARDNMPHGIPGARGRARTGRDEIIARGGNRFAAGRRRFSHKPLPGDPDLFLAQEFWIVQPLQYLYIYSLTMRKCAASRDVRNIGGPLG